MDDGERKHYELLIKNYNILIKMILGNDYYTIASQVYFSDIEAFEDMKMKINKMKRDLKMLKGILTAMFVILTILVFKFIFG